MKMRSKFKGFTIVELLTVMGIIAILIGLLVPALNLVKDYSKQIQQRAQFHSIDVGIEMFKNDFGTYPESNDNSDPIVGKANPYDPTVYCGANKLAEALAGWDLLGFHPKSGFTASGINDIDGDNTTEKVYNPITGFTSSTTTYSETAAQNIANRRKYIDLENANAFRVHEIYTTPGPFALDVTYNFFALCDVYAKKRLSGKKTGMPILYYRARAAYQFQDYTDANANNDDIYYFYDNQNLLDLGTPEDSTTLHPLFDGTDDLLNFEEMILNKQVQQATMTAANPQGVKRPYRNDSYILISAGKDGLYGTADDVFNFTKEAEQ